MLVDEERINIPDKDMEMFGDKLK